VFLTSSSLIIRPIAEIDGRKISKKIPNGKNRQIARLLNDAYSVFIS